MEEYHQAICGELRKPFQKVISQMQERGTSPGNQQEMQKNLIFQH